MVMMQYSVMANNYWLLVEGLYLHSLLVITVFSEKNYFYIYLCIGWGVWVFHSHILKCVFLLLICSESPQRKATKQHSFSLSLRGVGGNIWPFEVFLKLHWLWSGLFKIASSLKARMKERFWILIGWRGFWLADWRSVTFLSWFCRCAAHICVAMDDSQIPVWKWRVSVFYFSFDLHWLKEVFGHLKRSLH